MKQSEGGKAYRCEGLDRLDGDILTIVLSDCPHRLLTLALKGTTEPLKERIMSLLTSDRNLLVLNDLNELRFDDLGRFANWLLRK